MEKNEIKINCKNIIMEIAGTLRNIMYSKNIAYSVVRMIFLKYVTDNCLGAESKEDFVNYMNVQKMFAARDCEGGPNAIHPILHKLDMKYGLRYTLDSAMNEYGQELFGMDENWGRKNTTFTNYKETMSVLGMTNLEETNAEDPFELGKAMVSCLTEFIDRESGMGAYMARTTTPESISKIAEGILQLKDGETFSDIASGIGLSTLEIVKDKQVKIYNNEINNECRSIAAMLYIMSGYNNFDITDNDVIAKRTEVEKCNKLFVDGPIGVKVDVLDSKYDSVYLSIESGIESLKENGIAVVTCSGGTLFKGTNRFIEQRKDLINKGYVKAIISLPACWNGTVIGTNLLVLSKENNDKVMFVNATSNNVMKIFNKGRGANIITDEAITTIVDIVNNSKEINGISKLCNIEEIDKEEYNLTPAMYVVEPTLEDDTTIEEIDDELKKLYAKLLK